jgi:hypothetical protein
MKHTRFFLCFLLLNFFCIAVLQSQSAISTAGGNASGTGGSASFTVGQILYTTNTGTSGSVAQGVQQPYELSVITAIKNTQDIYLECSVYPNPTRGIVKLITKSDDFEDLRFQLYDQAGMLLQNKKVESEETEISLDSFLPAVYFLKVLSAGKLIKTFKIIKN